jgi:hypothetical protein
VDVMGLRDKMKGESEIQEIEKRYKNSKTVTELIAKIKA